MANIHNQKAPTMFKTIQKFARDNKGVTLIEYGLIAVLIGVAVVAILGTVGTNLNTTFSKVSTAIVKTPAAPPAEEE